jgi:hypothetical protein
MGVDFILYNACIPIDAKGEDLKIIANTLKELGGAWELEKEDDDYIITCNKPRTKYGDPMHLSDLDKILKKMNDLSIEIVEDCKFKSMPDDWECIYFSEIKGSVGNYTLSTQRFDFETKEMKYFELD